MPTQNVNLPDHLAAFIRETTQGGRYQNASEVVRAELRLLETHEEEQRLKLEPEGINTPLDQNWVSRFAVMRFL